MTSQTESGNECPTYYQFLGHPFSNQKPNPPAPFPTRVGGVKFPSPHRGGVRETTRMTAFPQLTATGESSPVRASGCDLRRPHVRLGEELGEGGFPAPWELAIFSQGETQSCERSGSVSVAIFRYKEPKNERHP